MAKTKISEYDSTANNNTDVASVNIDEGCAPSGINNAIRAVMAHLKDFQQGTNGDSFNGPVNGTIGATTPAAGTFTTLATTGNTTLGNDSGDVITINGSTSFGAGAGITGNLTLSSGTANGVAYLNGSKVLTTGSALTFDGTSLKNSASSSGATPSANGNQLVLESSGNAGLTIATGASSLGNIFFADSGDNADGFIQYDQSGRTLRFGALASEQMRLTSTGLGIGTSSPEVKLDVAGTGVLCRLTGTGGQFQGMQIRNNYASASQPADVFYDAVNESGAVVANMLGSVQTDGGSSWTWSTQPPGTRTDRRVDRMRIDSSGNLLVGTTGFAGGGRTQIQIGSGSSDIGTRYRALNNGNWACGFENASASIVGQIVIGASATTYNTSSDYRLKEDIQPMTGALAKVAALKPCTYKWKADGSDGEGFIAHELAEVCPQAVTGEKDAVDAEGNPQYQGIDVSFLVGTLTAAIQEQQAIIEQLKADVAALKGA